MHSVLRIQLRLTTTPSHYNAGEKALRAPCNLDDDQERRAHAHQSAASADAAVRGSGQTMAVSPVYPSSISSASASLPAESASTKGLCVHA